MDGRSLEFPTCGGGAELPSYSHSHILLVPYTHTVLVPTPTPYSYLHPHRTSSYPHSRILLPLSLLLPSHSCSHCHCYRQQPGYRAPALPRGLACAGAGQTAAQGPVAHPDQPLDQPRVGRAGALTAHAPSTHRHRVGAAEGRSGVAARAVPVRRRYGCRGRAAVSGVQSPVWEGRPPGPHAAQGLTTAQLIKKSPRNATTLTGYSCPRPSVPQFDSPPGILDST